VAKLLLVEDDNNLREIYQARLTAEGYDIIAAQNGEEALSVAKEQRPDLIISDVMMPRISGFEMLDILRDTPELRDTKVIMLTALGQAEDQARAGKLGADKYLVKSQVTLEDIVNTARDLLAGTTVVNPEPLTTPAADTVAPATARPADLTAAAVTVPTVSNPSAPAIPEPSAAAIDPLITAPIVAGPVPSAPLEPAAQVVSTPDPAPVVAMVTDPDPLSSPVSVATSVSEPLITTHGSPMLSTDSSPVPVPEPTMPPTQVAVVVPPVEPSVSPQDTPISPVQDTSAPVAANLEAPAPQPPIGEALIVEDQINAFANSLPGTPPPVVTPIPTPTERSLQPTVAENDATLAAAMNELTAAVGAPAAPALPPSQQTVPGEPAQSTDAAVFAPAAPIVAVEPVAPVDPSAASAVPDTAPPAPEPTPVANDSEQVEVAGKKVIAPINDISHGPDLNDLLAKEVAKEQGAQPSPTEGIVASGDAAAPAPAQPAATSEPSVDPNSIAL
jgi:CheY-like chemotaxis protein